MRPPPPSAPSLLRELSGPSPTAGPERVPKGLLAGCTQLERVPARSGARVLAASHLAPAAGGVPAGIARAARSPRTWHGVRPRLERRRPRPAPPARRLRPRRRFPLRFRLTQRRRRPRSGEYRWADARGPGVRWARGAGRGEKARSVTALSARKLRSEPREGWGREGRGQRGGGAGRRRAGAPLPPGRGAPPPPWRRKGARRGRTRPEARSRATPPPSRRAPRPPRAQEGGVGPRPSPHRAPLRLPGARGARGRSRRCLAGGEGRGNGANVLPAPNCGGGPRRGGGPSPPSFTTGSRPCPHCDAGRGWQGARAVLGGAPWL